LNELIGPTLAGLSKEDVTVIAATEDRTESEEREQEVV
jgi:hypothetical protein